MRAPDVEGIAGKAWIVGREEGDHVDTTATICCWLLHVPGAHPAWSWYTFQIVHLRDIPGQSKPAHRRYPEAEYELMILALHPDHQPDPDDPKSCGNFLVPVNVVEQFHGLTDEQAREMGRQAVTLICRGQASPDSDYRRWWAEAIPRTVQHVAMGGHPKAST